MDFSISGLAAGFLFGVIGFYLMKEAWKRDHYPHLFAGLAMMVYPYFVSGPWMDWGIGAVLCAFVYFTR
jgi:NhaP-type Na+/H+ or K+/H+ antiporter